MSLFSQFKTFSGKDPAPIPQENTDINLCIKNHLLFSKIEDILYACTTQEHFLEAYNYYNKLDSNLALALLDNASYDRLYHKYLEFKTDKELSLGLQENNSNEIIEEDEALDEFLRISSDILTSEESAPIIKFVNSLFYQAVKKGASDIHIETHETRGIVRFRIDGVMVKYIDMDIKAVGLVISRIKIISNLDIAEKRVPQDGRTRITIASKKLDIRISTLPTYSGERVVMRILMEAAQIPSMSELGFPPDLTQKFYELLKHSHGMILVTGPTGSGKSTTLHAFLQTIATPQKTVIAIEDPVEYKAENVNQIQVNTKAGLTFASGLRSILRQDPDVIMVGEIRDQETSKIAIQAALTGHLMLSTLHTNNTTATITRLVDMGIEEYLISSSLLGVLSQRLVRQLCSHCKTIESIDAPTCKEFNLQQQHTYYSAQGCEHCNFTGYIGRQAVGELFIINQEIKELIRHETNDFALREHLRKKGVKLLSDSLRELLEKGVTSLEEVIRVGIKEV